MFLDEAILRVRTGNGGDGCVSFYRARHTPRGGPDGGDGGDGGDVVLRADASYSTLMDIPRKSIYAAKNGSRGRGDNRTGKSSATLVIPVPVGTVVREQLPNVEPVSGPLVGELLRHDQLLVVARGGKGGRGNKAFTTATRQAPRTAEDGQIGEVRVLYLELKLLADVGLIGLPNAGKSTLLSRVSSATPKIANYPFTTIKPNLGIANVGGFRRLVIADIPGLIEGAHEGHGLGIEFLRHIERTRLLVHLVSAEAVLEEETGGNRQAAIDCLAQNYRTVESELSRYSSRLQEKKQILVLTKSDLFPRGVAQSLAQDFHRAVERPVQVISSATGEGIEELLRNLDDQLRADSSAIPVGPST